MIRTSDPLVPNQLRYQAALRPEERNDTFTVSQNQLSVESFHFFVGTKRRSTLCRLCMTLTCNPLSHFPSLCSILGFNHDTYQGFCTRCPDKHSATITQFRFDFLFCRLQGNIILPVKPWSDPNIYQRLRIQFQFTDERWKRSVMATKSCQYLQGRNDTITGSMFVETDQMSRSLSTATTILFPKGSQEHTCLRH